MASWTFVNGIDDDLGQLCEPKLELRPQMQLNKPAPLKATKSQPTPSIPEVVPINKTNNRTNGTQWNFTGARLKPHVVGVHFDNYSNYLGNWSSENDSSTKKKQKKTPTPNTGVIHTRNSSQVKRSLKKKGAGNRGSLPTNFSAKIPNDRNRSNLSTHTYAQKNPATTGLRVSGDMLRSQLSRNDRPQYRKNDNINLQNQTTSRPQYMMNSNPQTNNSNSSNMPAALQRHYSDQSDQCAPEPLYRSYSMPQKPEANNYTVEPHAVHQLLEYHENNFSNRSSRLQPTHYYQYNNNYSSPSYSNNHSPSPSYSNNHSPSHQMSPVQKFASVDTYQSLDFDLGELEGIIDSDDTRIQPTHVYFNDDASSSFQSYPSSSPQNYQHTNQQNTQQVDDFFQGLYDSPQESSHNSNSNSYGQNSSHTQEYNAEYALSLADFSPANTNLTFRRY